LHKLNLIKALFGAEAPKESTSEPKQPQSQHRPLTSTKFSSPGSLHQINVDIPEDPAMSPKGTVKHL
jgi:hypothetical protein